MLQRLFLQSTYIFLGEPVRKRSFSDRLGGVFPISIFKDTHRTFDSIVPRYIMLLASSCMCCPAYAAGGIGTTKIFNKALKLLEAWDPELTCTIFYIIVAFIIFGYFIKHMARYRKCTSEEFLLGILSFKGTIGRIEYLLSLVALPVILVLAEFIVEFFLSDKTVKIVEDLIDAEKSKYLTWWFLFMLISYIYIALSQGAKRCHDLGHSGWFQLIPFYGLWMIFKQGIAHKKD